jgi:hypothetical protein
MKRFAIFLAGVVVTSSLALSSRAVQVTATRPSVDEQNRALAARVDELEKQVAKLKAELKSKEAIIQQQQRAFTLTPQIVPLPQITPPSLSPESNLRFYGTPDVPRGAVPQQFNGSTFYLVPLNAEPLLDDRSGPTRELIHGK